MTPRDEQFDGLTNRLLYSAQLYSWHELQEDPVLPPDYPGLYAWFFKLIPGGISTNDCLQRGGKTLPTWASRQSRPKAPRHCAAESDTTVAETQKAQRSD